MMEMPVSRKAQQHKNMLMSALTFADRAREKERGRAYQHKRMTRSNQRYVRRPENWREWLQAVLMRRKFRRHSKPLPVSLRPWVPRVREALDAGDTWAMDKARDVLPGWQWEAVFKPWIDAQSRATLKKAA